MENIKEIIANNLIYLRKKNNLTQGQLAEKINYSDNAISRWERCEVTPSVENLQSISEFFKVSIRDLLDENFKKNYETESSQSVSRILIIIFSISIVWFITIISYIYTRTILNANFWLLFVLGVPVSSLIALYYNKKWGNKIMSIVLSSLTAWSVITCIYLYFLPYNLWPIFLLGIPTQSALITVYYLRPIKEAKQKKVGKE